MKITDLIFWLLVIVYFTDGSSTLIELIHGPQPKAEAPAKPPADRPKVDGEIKSDW